MHVYITEKYLLIFLKFSKKTYTEIIDIIFA